MSVPFPLQSVDRRHYFRVLGVQASLAPSLVSTIVVDRAGVDVVAAAVSSCARARQPGGRNLARSVVVHAQMHAHAQIRCFPYVTHPCATWTS